MRRTLQKLNIRLTALSLVVLFLLCLAPVARADEVGGVCGDNLTWSLNDGLLTIEGSGNMWDFDEDEMAPWYSEREHITRVSLPEGLGSVGELAFYDCSSITNVVLPSGVSTVGEYAFASCENLTQLNLGAGITSLDTGAFYGCTALYGISLPEGLESIGSEAFYRCSSLTTIVVPASVTEIDPAAFAYCTELVRAEIQGEVAELPEWLFFGCNQLAVIIIPGEVEDVGSACFDECESLYMVVYEGDKLTVEELVEIIDNDVEDFKSTGSVSNENTGGAVTSGKVTEHGDGNITETSTTVNENSNSSVSATVQHTHSESTNAGGTFAAEITATVDNDDGWEEAAENIKETLDSVQERVDPATEVEQANVTVYMKDSESVSESFVNSLAGRDAMLTVVDKEGASWKIDCGTMNSRELSGEYDLRYTVEECSEAQRESMGAERGFTLKFMNDAQVNAELLIRLPDSTARMNVTLFEKTKKEIVRHQTTIVDGSGYAHFYLGAVSADAEYLIGVNVPSVPDAPVDEAIVPETLYSEYGIREPIDTMEYVITGRKSSWGMNITQVTWIMMGVLFVCVVGVGITMFLLNKRKLKRGYIPDLDEE